MKIRNKLIINISITIIVGISISTILALRTYIKESGNHGFARTQRLKVSLRSAMMKGSIIDIGGKIGDEIYFKTNKSNEVIITGIELEKPRKKNIDLSLPYELDFTIESIIDTPFSFLVDGNRSGIIRYDIDNAKKVSNIISLSDAKFTRSVRVSKNSFAFREFIIDSVNKSLYQNFTKFNIVTGQKIFCKEYKYNSLESSITNDGLLHYDSVNKQLIYVSFYSNGITGLDTNLNIVFKGKTIDTTSLKELFAENNLGKDYISFSANKPKKLVNKYNCVDNGILYNYSGIISDNEDNSDFRNNSVIDMYSISERKYIGSFYVPNYLDERPITFRVYKKNIIVVYKNNVAIYNILG